MLQRRATERGQSLYSSNNSPLGNLAHGGSTAHAAQGDREKSDGKKGRGNYIIIIWVILTADVSKASLEQGTSTLVGDEQNMNTLMISTTITDILSKTNPHQKEHRNFDSLIDKSRICRQEP